MPDDYRAIRSVSLPDHSATSSVLVLRGECRLPVTCRAGECHECYLCGACKTCLHKGRVQTVVANGE